MSTTVEFNEERHEYRVAGEIVPSVTQILADLSMMKRLDPERLADAANRGRLVHRAVHLYNMGDLDEDSLHQNLEPYVRGWKRFCDDHKYEPLVNETILFSERWNYAGTNDTYGTLKRGRKRMQALVDVKSGVEDPVHGPQLAGYIEPLKELGLVLKNEVPLRLIVRLQPNGFYQIDEYADPMDWATFMAALTCYKFKEKRGLL